MMGKNNRGFLGKWEEPTQEYNILIGRPFLLVRDISLFCSCFFLQINI